MRNVLLRALAIGCCCETLIRAAVAEETAGPQFPRVIAGRVTDADGAAVAGALVEWGYFDATGEEREFTTTDAEGRYRLETSTAGRDFRLAFSRSGFAPQWRDGLVPGPASKPTAVDATLQAGTVVELQLTTEAGEPVAGMTLRVTTASNGFHSSFSTPPPSTPLPGPAREFVTDVDGRVTLVDLPAKPEEVRRWGEAMGGGSYSWLRLELRSESGGWYEQNITDEAVLGEGPVVIKLPDDQVQREAEELRGMVRGRVVDAETGQPISHFWTTRRHVAETHAVDDADGQFTLGGNLQIGREYEVRVFAAGYDVAPLKLTAADAADAQPQAVELLRHPSFEGRLVDAATGSPIAGVEIVAGAADERGFKYVEWSTLDRMTDGYHGFRNVLRVTTDEHGRFTVPEAPNMPATLVVLTEDYGRRIVPPTQRATPDADGVVAVSLEPAATVTAVAVRETPLGAAAGSAAITYRSDDGFQHMYHALPLDDEGRLTVGSLAPGGYGLTLYLNVGHFGFPCYSKRFTLAAGQKKSVLLGPMPGVLRLYGAAPPFAVVQVQPRFETDVTNLAVQADVDGWYELTHLEPGEYEVTMDVSSAARGYRSDLPSVRVTLEADLELDLTRRLPNGRND